MDIELVEIKKPDGTNVILGHSHFIKTVEDIHEAMVNSVPGVKFGVAFCEASEKRLVRWSGTDDEMVEVAKKNAHAVGAGHFFIIAIKDAFPINFMHILRNVPEICTIYCATANPLKVIVAVEGEQRGVMGVLDGLKPVGIETQEDVEERRSFLRKIGYKF